MADHQRRTPDAPGDDPSARARPQFYRWRLAVTLLGLTVLALVSTVFGMMMAVAQDLPELESQNEFREARNSVLYATGPGRQEGPAGGADRRREPHPGRLRRHLLQREAGGGRDRGPALLHAQGRRLPGHRPRPVGGPAAPARRPGRVDDHAAVREERAGRAEEPLAVPEAQGGRARLPARAQVDQGEDPHRVPEHRLLRRGRVRDRVGGARLLRLEPPRLRAALRGRPGARRGGAAGRDDRLARRLQPGPEPGRRDRAAQPGAAAHARAVADHHERADGGRAAGAAAAQQDRDAEEDQPRAVLHRLDRGPARGPVRER